MPTHTIRDNTKSHFIIDQEGILIVVSGGSYIYRSSKAGVNAAMRSLSFEVAPQGIASAVLHPGWVRTDMGGPNGLIDAPESVSGMRAVIAALDAGMSGRFWNYDGTEIPW